MTDKEIEIQMEKAIDKIPWEIKKIKVIYLYGYLF